MFYSQMILRVADIEPDQINPTTNPSHVLINGIVSGGIACTEIRYITHMYRVTEYVILL